VRLPKCFREGHDGSLAYPHRDVSTCEACERLYPQIVDVLGAHYWIDDPKEREALRSEVQS